MRKFGKYLSILLTIIIVSFYFFPFEFKILPGMNTKKIMAGLGLGALLINLAKHRNINLDKRIISVFLFAAGVSIIGFVSCVYNHTHDYTYASYLISFLVWMSAAFYCVEQIKFVHKYIDFKLLVNYLIAAALFQCIMAMLIDSIPAVKSFVDSIVINIFDAASRNRLYGIGASLDVGGSRFAIVLLLITTLIHKYANTLKTLDLVLYFVSMWIIIIVGCMIGRTAIVGVIVSILYIILSKGDNDLHTSNALKIGISVCLFTIAACIILYKASPAFQDNLRFGFEGFFSLAETGKWETNSNNGLMHMFIFPDNLKTWIIGDGYFNGAAKDVNFLGDPTMMRFYMRTDVGYCRFIFYFGVVGLITFMIYFAKCTTVCASLLPRYALMFSMMLLMNYVIWIKVSTDLFPAFALFLCMARQGNDDV